VTFKDEPLAEAYPGWAVIDSHTGLLWRDGEGFPWTIPVFEEVLDYNIAVAAEAVGRGFDEIQFDYVRFPSDGYISRAVHLRENTRENRVAAIAGFLEKASQALRPLGARVSADIFGYAAWLDDDLGIGQDVEDLAPYLDVLAPMLYPSTYSSGLPGHDPPYTDAISYPYEIVHECTERALERALSVNPDIEVRPWIQDFRDYAFDGRHYTPGEIRLQMDGAREAGSRGWMLWDPAVIYTPEALVSAEVVHSPNPYGGVLVLAYHSIGHPEDTWRRTPENFRADLERLLAEGYYPVNLRDLVEGDLSMVPAGKRPVVLTFDDSTLSQFRIDPSDHIDAESAVGILKNFHDAHSADWPLRGTFLVRASGAESGSPPFGQSDRVALKLATLVYWGMEVGTYIPRDVKLNELGGEEVQWELSRSRAELGALLPGYNIVSLGLPDGTYPQDPALLAAGESGGMTYAYRAAVQYETGLAPSPVSPYFRPYHIPRVRATQPAAEYWLEYANRPGAHYVSPGE
jgi:hypothetical protein